MALTRGNDWVGKSYTACRQTASVLDKARVHAARGSTTRAAIDEALAALYAVEDELIARIGSTGRPLSVIK